jgi:pyruvate dehydrogenase E2 component (dihydrolipoamide acetyltransferase)
VDTDRGLVVPVLRDADRKSISQIASELDELASTVREGQFDLDLLSGGTFTISNLGSVGGIYSTPIINPPQVAILLIGRTRAVPHIVDDVVVPRLMMPLSITYDHRLVDGAAAARFTNEVKSFLAAPGRLLLAP